MNKLHIPLIWEHLSQRLNEAELDPTATMHRKACGFIDYHQLSIVVNDSAVDSLRPAIWNTSLLFRAATEMGVFE